MPSAVQQAVTPVRPAVDPQDVEHSHQCVDYPACTGEWTHTPRQSWDTGRWRSHECPKCRKVQFTPTEGEHDVES